MVPVEEQRPLAVISGYSQRQPFARTENSLQHVGVPSEERVRLQSIPGMGPDQLFDRRDPITVRSPVFAHVAATLFPPSPSV
jgi:hypothetical protein